MSFDIEFDESEGMTYGCWYCPKCGSAFYGGGQALHDKGCELKGYDGLIYHFGQKELDIAKSRQDDPALSPRGFFEKVKAKYPDMV